jgi:hypothetical protein
MAHCGIRRDVDARVLKLDANASYLRYFLESRFT